MAATEVSYRKTEKGYESDPITANGDKLVIRIEYTAPGRTYLMRSITGENFVQEALIERYQSKEKTIETNVSGVVSGQILKIVFVESVPHKIYALQ